MTTGTPDINSSEPCNTSLVLHEPHTTRRSEFPDGSSPYDANRSLLGEIKNTGTGFTITTGSTHLLTIHFKRWAAYGDPAARGPAYKNTVFSRSSLFLPTWTAISVRVGIHAVHHRSSIQSHRSHPFGVMGIMHNKRVISSVGIFDGEQ